MRRWQFLLELLLHHAPIAVPLCWSFYLGRLVGLSLRVCYFPLQWPWLAEDRMVLSDASQQLGPSLLILERFFFLGVGLGLDMKWAGLCQILQPHSSNLNLPIKLLFYPPITTCSNQLLIICCGNVMDITFFFVKNVKKS